MFTYSPVDCKSISSYEGLTIALDVDMLCLDVVAVVALCMWRGALVGGGGCLCKSRRI